MISILLALMLWGQNPSLQSDNGAISGVLKSSDGKPVAGVRVSAMVVPESDVNAAAGAAMISIVATDDMGRYRLENIPPGRYFIVAGRVDFPTYFPGAQEMSAGTIVSVAARANLSGLDFTLKDASFRLAGINNDMMGIVAVSPAITVPVQVIGENGIKQPASANGKIVKISLTRLSDGVRDEAPLSDSVAIPFFSAAIGAEYRVAVENLPDGYAVKAMKYGGTDLTKEMLKVDATNFQQLTSRNVLSGTSVLSIFTAGATTYTGLRSGTPSVSGAASSRIVVTLAASERSTPLPPGLRITGKAPVTGGWSIFRGTTPGTFFADGTFELTGVPEGKHIVLLQEDIGSHFYAAYVSVADRDVDGVTLDSVGVLPNNLNLSSTAANGPAGTRPLAGLLGRVTEEENGKPLNRGMVVVLGQSMATISIGTDGQFIIPNLLPGSYDLRIEAFEHFTLYQTVVIADEDKHVDFKIRSSLSPAVEQ